MVNPKPPPPPPTLNFSGTSRGPTTKCYTFLETSYDPRLRSQLRCKNFANFFATLFRKLKLSVFRVPTTKCWIYLFGNFSFCTLFCNHFLQKFKSRVQSKSKVKLKSKVQSWDQSLLSIQNPKSIYLYWAFAWQYRLQSSWTLKLKKRCLRINFLIPNFLLNDVTSKLKQRCLGIKIVAPNLLLNDVHKKCCLSSSEWSGYNFNNIWESKLLMS